jgi:hypothetical protein
MPRLNNFRKSIPSKNDEIFTPPILVKPIIKYLKSGSTIWCPFDTADSEFVHQLGDAGFSVIYTHLWTGQDFFHYEPDKEFGEYDYIISNPPFSRKLEVLERLYQLDKPFAMVLGLPILNYQEVGAFFISKHSDLQLLIFDKKVSFNGNTSSFNNSYFCRKLLPKDIIFEHLEHNNTKEKFEPSRMFLNAKKKKAQPELI